MKKFMTLEDCNDLMFKAMPEITENTIKRCYCYSKMTIVDEIKNMEKYH